MDNWCIKGTEESLCRVEVKRRKISFWILESNLGFPWKNECTHGETIFITSCIVKHTFAYWTSTDDLRPHVLSSIFGTGYPRKSTLKLLLCMVQTAWKCKSKYMQNSYLLLPFTSAFEAKFTGSIVIEILHNFLCVCSLHVVVLHLVRISLHSKKSNLPDHEEWKIKMQIISQIEKNLTS